MKKPTIRVAKWLGDIPVEAGCSACPGVVFRAKGSGHRPNSEEFQKSGVICAEKKLGSSAHLLQQVAHCPRPGSSFCKIQTLRFEMKQITKFEL
jgi:hypothetical protein